MTRPCIGFIGTGMMGQLAHLANYAQLRDAGECEIAGLTDLKLRLAEAVAAKYRICNVYANAEELLADPRVSAVVCIQQWPNNYPLVKQILNAGKSAITEKPMVGRLDEAEELAALAGKRGVHYAVGFMKRYDPGVELAKALVTEVRASNQLGPLLTIDALCDGAIGCIASGSLCRSTTRRLCRRLPQPIPTRAGPRSNARLMVISSISSPTTSTSATICSVPRWSPDSRHFITTVP